MTVQIAFKVACYTRLHQINPCLDFVCLALDLIPQITDCKTKLNQQDKIEEQKNSNDKKLHPLTSSRSLYGSHRLVLLLAVLTQ
jgi:hypothetical protein